MAVTGRKAIMHRYPVDTGLTAETTKQEGRQSNLVAEKSFVSQRDRVGLD
jgi:hypothetical protein